MRRDVEDLARKKLPDVEVGEFHRVGSFGDANAHVVVCRLLYRTRRTTRCFSYTVRGKGREHGSNKQCACR